MDDAHRQARNDVEDLIKALGELRLTIRSAETSSKRALKLLEGEIDMRSALEAIQPAEVRALANESLNAVERARHSVRLSIFALGIEQGLSIGELGRAWGFSRQLATRYAKEVRERGQVDGM